MQATLRKRTQHCAVKHAECQRYTVKAMCRKRAVKMIESVAQSIRYWCKIQGLKKKIQDLLGRCASMSQSTVSSGNLALCQTNLFVEDQFFRREQSVKRTTRSIITTQDRINVWSLMLDRMRPFPACLYSTFVVQRLSIYIQTPAFNGLL